MSSSTTTHERARLRRSLIGVGTLLVLTLLASGLISLFAIWSMARMHSRDQMDQSTLLDEVNNARAAQVEFKIQVQDWKNIYLRGGRPGDYEAANAEFLQTLQETDDSLQQLGRSARLFRDVALAARVDELIAEHARVDDGYRNALPKTTSSFAERESADTAVRGIDRGLNRALDKLVADLILSNQQRFTATREAENQRFIQLTRAVWLALVISLALVTLLIWRTLRDPALRG